MSPRPAPPTSPRLRGKAEPITMGGYQHPMTHFSIFYSLLAFPISEHPVGSPATLRKPADKENSLLGLG